MCSGGGARARKSDAAKDPVEAIRARFATRSTSAALRSRLNVRFAVRAGGQAERTAW
jgi:hypothetical protein